MRPGGMQIAILHFHLNPGGVTQVIANHLRAIDAALPGQAAWRVVVLHGGEQEGWPDKLAAECEKLDVAERPVLGLGYDTTNPLDSDELARRIRQALEAEGFFPGTTVLHVHNHALGKNTALPGALARLAESGFPMLLQLHDFAEDFRGPLYSGLADRLTQGAPDALPKVLYPQADGIHYAVLNQRDYRILQGAGVPTDRLHAIPNPVIATGTHNLRGVARQKLYDHYEVPLDRPFFLYPVRGIRRKNLGELLLWAAVGGEEASFGCTLAPRNPIEQPAYDAWKALVHELDLPCVLELGEQLSFAENLAAADRVITTSVAEGFGMVFLETWVVGRTLVGRNLPEITVDFIASGLRLDALYDRLAVPIDWVGFERAGDAFLAAYATAIAAYGRSLPSRALQTTGAEWLVQDGTIDFAFLSVDLQREVIRRVQGSERDRTHVRDLNPPLDAALRRASACDALGLAYNEKIVRAAYSPVARGEQLVSLYEQLAGGPAGGVPAKLADGDRILDAFLEPSRFHPLRL